MDITLPPELERYVKQKVESGDYKSTSDVIDAGLRLLRQQEASRQDKLVALRGEIAVGIEQADQGKTRPLDARELLERVRQKRGDSH